MARREYIRDEWEGSGAGNSVYDEKEDKKYQARIWVCIAAVMAVVIIYLTGNLISEVHMILNANYIVAEYDVEHSIATYTTEDGRHCSFDVSGFYPKHDGDKIKMYYTDDVNMAIPQNTLISWLKNYAFVGVIFALCVWRIVVIFKGK